ncbi:MAG TPA: glycine oxidase ThiO [Streptosporangiaceae bacterium]|nr:glycine oxidase ThiO [Streptosporangiaceae bacterium]
MSVPVPAECDALIIGGGVIGMSIAWRTAQQGLSVVIADPRPGLGATHAAAGMLTPIAEAAYAEREIFALGQESLRRYPDFISELQDVTGLPAGFRQAGTLQVAYDSDDLALLAETRVLQESFGVHLEQLSARDCREAEPMLDPAVRGGLLAPDDGSVDPRLLAVALLDAAERSGAQLVRQAVTEICCTAGRAGGARLADDRVIAARWIVLAAGWESAGLPGLPAGVAPPVRPVKGQIIRLRTTGQAAAAGLPPGLLRRTVRGVVRGSSVYLVPRDSGELVIGATQEELGPDTTVTAGGVWELLRDARTLVPGITELELQDMTAGLRPGTPDNSPVLGQSELPGLVLATGHFRAGVLLAPVTADTVAAYLRTGTTDPIWAAFRADRFRAHANGMRAAARAGHPEETAACR